MRPKPPSQAHKWLADQLQQTAVSADKAGQRQDGAEGDSLLDVLLAGMARGPTGKVQAGALRDAAARGWRLVLFVLPLRRHWLRLIPRCASMEPRIEHFSRWVPGALEPITGIRNGLATRRLSSLLGVPRLVQFLTVGKSAWHCPLRNKS